MSKCKKVKNPCKICLGTVTQKTGLQCQGACESWVHYSCLNYTPGKIKDIKAGLINVRCPCPDCKSSMPKELLTNEPFSCSNIKCPANHPPKCEMTECPANAEGPDKMSQTPPPMPPLAECGKECKKHSPAPGQVLVTSPGTQGLEPCDPRTCTVPPCIQRPNIPSDTPQSPSPASSSNDVPGDYRQSPVDGLPLGALEQMCNTVGQLTNQINSLMNKMKQFVQEQNGPGGGGVANRKRLAQKAPKSSCPKPCFCPGNPGTRK